MTVNRPLAVTAGLTLGGEHPDAESGKTPHAWRGLAGELQRLRAIDYELLRLFTSVLRNHEEFINRPF